MTARSAEPRSLSRRAPVTVALAVVAVGCGADRAAPPPPPWPDPSALPVVAATSASAPSAPPPRPFALAEALARVHEVATVSPSQHVAGEYDARVLANDLAQPYPKLGAVQSLPSGALIVEALSRAGTAAPALYFIMQKGEPLAGAAPVWEYLVVEANGTTDARGESLLCARCHAEAPRDHLFGRSR